MSRSLPYFKTQAAVIDCLDAIAAAACRLWAMMFKNIIRRTKVHFTIDIAAL